MDNIRKLYNYCDAVRDVMALQGRPIPEPIKAIRRVHLTDMPSLLWHAIAMSREPMCNDYYREVIKELF